MKLGRFRLTMRRPRRAGFSLLDVLIGTVVLALAMFSALALAGNNARLVAMNQNLAAASLLAQNKLEELRNAEYATIASGADETELNSQGDVGEMYTRSWTVTNNTPMVGMKSIQVTVSWSQSGETQNYVLNGVVANDV